MPSLAKPAPFTLWPLTTKITATTLQPLQHKPSQLTTDRQPTLTPHGSGGRILWPNTGIARDAPPIDPSKPANTSAPPKKHTPSADQPCPETHRACRRGSSPPHVSRATQRTT